jgi:hypothetical protein
MAFPVKFVGILSLTVIVFPCIFSIWYSYINHNPIHHVLKANGARQAPTIWNLPSSQNNWYSIYTITYFQSWCNFEWHFLHNGIMHNSKPSLYDMWCAYNFSVAPHLEHYSNTISPFFIFLFTIALNRCFFLFSASSL